MPTLAPLSGSITALALASTLAGCSLLTPFSTFVAEDAGGRVPDGGAVSDAGIRDAGEAARDAFYPDAPGTVVLAVEVTGGGRVRSSAIGLDCSDSCRVPVAIGRTVALTASGDATHVLESWGADCASAGTSAVCTLEMSADRMVSAAFSTPSATLTVSVGGAGRISSDDAMIDCTTAGGVCSARIALGTHVTLHAVTTGADVFAAWSGASVCADAGSPDCAFDLAGDVVLRASFTDGRPVLTVSVEPGGSVASSPDAIIACPGDCDEVVTPGASITLVASVAEGYELAGWDGCVAGPPSTCTLTIPTGTTRVLVTAHFRRLRHVVTVAVLGGASSGTLVSSPPGIACTGSSCTLTVDHGTPVELSATPALHYMFAGWSGLPGCSADTCAFDVNADVSGAASFARAHRAVTVSIAGAAGAVRSLADGIDCTRAGGVTTGTCIAMVADGTSMDFVASPAAGQTLSGWSGACAGASGSTCTVAVGLADVTVSATFALARYALDVTAIAATAAGLTGSGSVGIAPATPESSCTAGALPCTNTYDHGTSVTLTAMHPASVSLGWGGDCIGAIGEVCTLSMTQARSARATFTPISNSVNVTVSGRGRVSSIGGTAIVDCRDISGDCSETLGVGEMITLRAYPDVGNDFTGWGGACAGALSDCTITVESLTQVSASFAPTQRSLTVTVSGVEGRVTDDRGRISCTAGTCSADYDDSAIVTLSPTGTAAYQFSSWTGACSGSGACAVTMSAARSVGANFTLRSYPVTITLSGSGQGRITGSGIDCGNAPGAGSTCTTNVPYGASVTLVGTPASGSELDAWSGGCTGTGPCMRTITGATMIDASFGPLRFDITVQLNPATAGTVTGRVSGAVVLTCSSASCVARVANGDTLTLSASANTGYRFGTWSRAGCLAGLPCTFTVNGPAIVTANYVRRYALTVSAPGYASGTNITVWSPATNTDLSGTSGCYGGSGCNFQLDEGTTARIHVDRFPQWQGVTGWSVSGCSGSTCDVTMTADRTVTATLGQLGYLAFATDSLYDGDLLGDAMPADAEADAICNAAAAGASLPGSYRAWLSSTTVSAASRFAGARGAWVLADGTPFAASLATLTSGQLLSTLRVTETGNPITSTDTTFWSNTLSSGAIANTSASSTCGNFTTTAGASDVLVLGTTDAADSTWSALASTYSPCNRSQRLACLQVSTSGPTYPVVLGPLRATDATLIFVSSATFAGNAGVPAMDAACASEAGAAGLTGSYLALISTTTAAAIARIPRPRPWVRWDGRTSVSGSGSFREPLPVLFDAMGARVAPDHERTWTGMSTTYTDVASTGDQSCGDWSQTASSGYGGHPTRVNSWSGGYTGDCATDRWAVYCVRAM